MWVSDTFFPQRKFAGICWVWLPMETDSLGAFFPTRGDKGDEVCICFLMQVCFSLVYFGFTYLLTTTLALAIPCKESALFLGEGNHPSSFPRSQSCPSSGPPPAAATHPWAGRLQKLSDSLHLGDLRFQLLFSQLATPSVWVFPFARVIFTQKGPWHLCWNYAMLLLPLPPWQAAESHPTSENMLRVPGAPWS